MQKCIDNGCCEKIINYSTRTKSLSTSKANLMQICSWLGTTKRKKVPHREYRG